MRFSTKKTRKSGKWRGALIYLALFGVAPTAFGAETTRYVSDYNGLCAAIAEYNSNKGDDFKVVLNGDVNLLGNLPQITGNESLTGVPNGNLTIVGNGHTIDGGGVYRGLYIDTAEQGGTVFVSNATFDSCSAQGGNGGDGASGGGGGLGAGGAIYAFSGDVVLSDVTACYSSAVGGNGGSVMQKSSSYAGGGGLGGDGGSGVVYQSGAANGGGVFDDGADATIDVLAGDGGTIVPSDPSTRGHYVDKTTPVGGNSGVGGGGGGSTMLGGAGGFGGGGGAGGSVGGAGGFGGGGGGGADVNTAGLGGFGAGAGGYVDGVESEIFSDTQGGGVGGGGAALGAAVFVGENANLTIAVSEKDEDSKGSNLYEIYGGSLTGGVGGGGTAQDGEAIGKGIFLLNDMTVQVAKGGKYVISDSIGGYAGSASVQADEDGKYANASGIVKTGDGTLVLNASGSSYTGDTVVRGGTLEADAEGAISSYSSLVVDKGSVKLNADQSVKGLSGASKDASVDLNSRTLTVDADAKDDDGSVYLGKIKGDGKLLKTGTGTLNLAGDSQDAKFTTELNGGTIGVMNDGAFGEGEVYYTRTDSNDQTAALNFASGVEIDSNITLKGNSTPMTLAGDSATLNGRIAATNGSTSVVALKMNKGAKLALTNTGVSTDAAGVKSYSKSDANSIAEYRLESGGLIVDVDSYEIDGQRRWFSSLGDADIVNSGDNSLAFSLTTDKPSAGMYFANDMVLESDWLTIGPTVLAGSTKQVNNIEYAGTTSGAGGLRIDVGNGATFKATGKWGHAFTDVKSGKLDVSNLSGSQVDVGALASTGNGVIYVGDKDLIVDVASPDDVVFDGAILGDGNGASVYKRGTGAWTMNLSNDSKVDSVQVDDGVFSLGKNHYDDGIFRGNDFAITLGSAGTFRLVTDKGATLTLNNFDASKGKAIEIGEDDEIVLSRSNKSTEIAAGLYGDGYLTLKNVKEDGKVKPWVLSGNNSNWNGTISAFDPYAEITLATSKSGAANGAISFGSHGTLNVKETTTLGSLYFDDNATLNVTSGKTFTLGNLLSSNPLYLNNSVMSIDGGGTVALSEGAGKTYYGATLVKGGSTLLVNGDNTIETVGSKRKTTTLTEGGVLALNYSDDSFENAKSIWGSPVNIDGDGAIVVKSKATNGEIELNEKFAFVGEGSNNLTFTTENANVLLRNTIDGRGALLKNGNGTLVLDGSGAFKEATVSDGVLQLGRNSSNVNSQLAKSDVLINGGSLTGWTNSLGSINLTDGSLKLSGAKTVSLTGSGNAFSMSGGTVYVGVIDANNYTNFKTTDKNATVAIDGGAFYVDTATSGVELEDGTVLTVVETGAGNMSADASKITIYDDIARKRFVVDSNALAEGRFNLVLKGLTFSDYARTANQKSVAGYLDKWVDGGYDPSLNDFFNALENNVAENPAALDQTTGEVRFSAMHAQMQTRNFIRQTLTREVLPSACNGGGVYSSAIRGQAWEYSNDEMGFTGWMSGIGASGDVNNHAGTSGYDYSMLGGVWGVELGSTSTNQLGFYYSYSNTEADTKTALGNAKINDNLFGLYLRASDAWGYTLATGSLGASDYKYNRAIALQNFDYQSFKGKTDGWSGSAYLERGFTFNLPLSQLQPFGGLQYTHLQADAFDETGSLSAVALSTDETEYDSLQGLIGARLTRCSQLAYGAFEWNAYVNWTHEFLDANAEGTVAMIGGPDGKYRIIGNGAGRDWVYAGVGGTLSMSQAFDVFGGCDVQTNDYVSLVNGNVGMRLKW